MSNAHEIGQWPNLFKLFKEAVLVVNKEEIIVYGNASAALLFGVHTNDFVGKSYEAITGTVFSKSINSTTGNFQQTIEIEGVAIDTQASIFLDHYVVVFTPINPVQISADVYEFEHIFNAIIESAVESIFIIDQRGTIQVANPAAYKLFGYLPGTLINQNISLLMPESDASRHDKYINNYIQTGQTKLIGKAREVTAKKSNGQEFPILLSVSQIKLRDKLRFSGIIHDITLQKVNEEKLRRYTNELERSNRDLQDFAYVSSHDLQEPLRKIRAFGDRLLQQEGDKMGENGKDYLQRMVNASGRMQNLINDLLTYSRVSTHSKAFEKTDLDKELDTVLTDLEFKLEQTGAEIKRGHLGFIEADASQIRQLFQNLIGNALKFKKANVKPIIEIKGQRVLVNPKAGATSGDEVLVITVQDNGIGFDQRYADRIFNVFQRLEGQRYEGSGIGLAICRKVVSRHGGTIEAFGELNVGTKFVLRLPVVQLLPNQ